MSRRTVLAVLLFGATFALPAVAAAFGAACCAPMRGGQPPTLTCCGTGAACAISSPGAPQAVLSAPTLLDTAAVSSAVRSSIAIRMAFSPRVSPTILSRSPVNLTILHTQLLI